jgi:uncharacterized damage-inducible protein DinB
MDEREHIIDQLQREFDGDPWHGPALAGILGGITAAQAFRRVVPQAHSIWELVLHMTGWKQEVTRRLQGHAAGEPEAGDWPMPAEPAESAWSAAKNDLSRVHRTLIEEIRKLPPGKLHDPVKDFRESALGTGLTVYQTLYGIVQHDVYHAGQISLLKRALQ